MSRASIPELLQVPAEEQDLDTLQQLLQWAVELEFATIPTYLSGMWSMQDETDPVYVLIQSVVMEEMLHLGLACNMLTAIGGTPQITAPTYPGPLPGGVEPDLTVYLAGLSKDTVQMYMAIEKPEQPLAAAAESFPTIGAFYDRIWSLFQSLNPALSATGQIPGGVGVPNPAAPGGETQESFGPIVALEGFPSGPTDPITTVQAAITTIKEQGEGTTSTPDADEFAADELAHYYRFGEIYNERKLVEVSPGKWEFSGDPVPFPTKLWPVAQVPPGGYPGVASVEAFNTVYAQLITHLQNAWPGAAKADPQTQGQELGNAIRMMMKLGGLAATIVQQRLPSGSGNYGPDFVPTNVGGTS
ncbi:MAG: ferritin-like protein [Actinomycetota bacterium]|nr:ferritin-like protein [Actinomycetota bacterium]MDQ5807535.1 ferritin-like protein [Actinomycetota bacterium]